MYVIITSILCMYNYSFLFLFMAIPMIAFPRVRCNFQSKKMRNKIYREKSIPMTALWCPAFSDHG